MKLKSTLCTLGTIGCLLLSGTAWANEGYWGIYEKVLTCSNTYSYHDHDSYFCYKEEKVLGGTFELNPWDIKVSPNGSIEVPLTIETPPNPKDLNSSSYSTTKNVLFKYVLPEKKAYENGKLVTDPTDKLMYDDIYDDIMGNSILDSPAELSLPPVERSYPSYDSYGNVKYYTLSYRETKCNVAHSRKDNVIYLTKFYSYGELYFPIIDEYYDGDMTTELTSYRLMKNNAGVWKEQKYNLFNKNEKGTSDWSVCSDQAAIEQLAQGLGVNGKGR